ncbi:Ig-like domain-containing protein [Maribacter sp. 2308TA10-17]|uniref:Ig-like domain-containing protein n=1 Tax=Maribacter sp. 2308TA10-17 TaxID=3386276 RepID=UPI0039BC74D9
MINKQYLVALFLAITTIGVLYFNTTQNSPSSDYQLLAVSDHEKLASGAFLINDTDHKLNKIGTFDANANVPKKNRSSARNIFMPAIDAVTIAKFLNGNLPTTTPNGNNNVPSLLSQTGAFSNLGSLTPSPGLIPYDMIEPFWSDGATKKRWMVIPNDGTHNTPDEQITLTDEAWDFPRGTVLIKHFEFPGKRLETRFEVKGDDDVYYYLTYKWNAEQTDATLLNDSVDEDVVVNGVTQSWHYPSRNECASCHFPQNGSVLGPKTRNLNKSIVYPSSGIEMNQLVNLSELGILTQNITNSNVSNYPAVAAKNDLTASIEDRARTYLDVNCASCHNPQVSNIAMFDARYSTPIENQNIIYGDVIYDEGLNNPKVIIPQDVSNSMGHFRMNSTQTGIEMPPISKDVVDAEGVQLIADWINSLTPATTSPPLAAFSASIDNGPAPLIVNFDASASTDADGDTLTYSWNFGDNSTAQGETASHVYTNPGSYTATLTVNDGQFSDQEITTIIVNNSSPGTNTVAFTDGTDLLAQNNYSGLPMGVIDMNGDGKDDIVQFNSAKNLRIQYQNDPDQQFTSYNHGQVSSNNQWGTAIADYDQNGYNDIMSGGAYDNLKIISNNNGTNSYSQSILPYSNIFLQGANFADINNDGWADIFACHDDGQSRAYQNNQNGSFSFNAGLIGTATTPSSDNSGNYASMWMDYDNDGDLDLYISKCRGGVTSSSDPRRINMLWQNDGDNNFTEVAEQANLKIGDQTWLSDFGDIDNDGDLDAIIINHGTGPNLMRNNGNGTFTEVTSGSGLLPTLQPQDFYGIQGFFKDFNNDGYIDLMVSGDNHYIFYNNGDGTFQNASNPFNSNQIQSFSVGDINHDGFLDIYAGYANGLNSPSSTRDRIWLNEGNSNNYLNIQLKGTQSNINGIGARVEVYGAWGIQIRDVRSGEGYGLVNSFTQHFGIGVNTQIDKIIVRWPSGIVDEILNPSANQFLVIIENVSIPVTNVSVSPNSATIIEEDTQQLIATITPSNATDDSVTWSSSDDSIAAVDTNGLVTAVTEGTATITVTTTDGNFTATSLISVNALPVPVTGVNVNPNSATLIEGNSEQLTAVVSPTNADDASVTWSSSDTSIATVTTGGLVTGISQGTATITASTADGNFTATSLITVEASTISVAGINIDPTTADLTVGDNQQLTFVVSPSDATDLSVTWSSSDATIATVNSSGLVTGIASGTATITVTTNDGNFASTATIEVIPDNTSTCTASGTILMQRYDDISGIEVSNLTSAANYPGNPSFTSELSSFEIQRNQGDNYGVRVSGYLCAPETGTYYFFVAGNNGSELSLSTSSDAAAKVRIAYHSNWAGNREWDKFTTQKSQGISLTQGDSYYVEALMKEGTFGDNLAIGWRRPSDGDGALASQVIPGNVLSPFIPDMVAVSGVSLSPTTLTLSESQTVMLNPTIAPSGASDQSVSWSSSDAAIASVDTNGLVTGISEGTATITVTTNDGGFTSQATIEVTSTVPNTCTASGSILMERYDDISGIAISDLTSAANYPENPSSTSELSLFEIPKNMGNNYGVRVSGYLCAPETGVYYFWVAGNNHSEISLSTSSNAADKVRIASHEAYASNRQWDKFPSQKSEGIVLTQGDTYYIEALMKEGTFGDNLAVAWRRPSDGNGSLPTEVIPGIVLSPLLANTAPSLGSFVEPDLQLILSPVPTRNILNIQCSFNNESESLIQLSIFDHVGRQVIGKVINPDTFNEQINVSQLPSGVYLLQLIKDEEVLTKKFSKR